MPGFIGVALALGVLVAVGLTRRGYHHRHRRARGRGAPCGHARDRRTVPSGAHHDRHRWAGGRAGPRRPRTPARSGPGLGGRLRLPCTSAIRPASPSASAPGPESSSSSTTPCARTDVYIGRAPRLRRAGEATAVGRVRTLSVDCDDVAGVDRLAVFSPAPAAVLRSGSDASVHAYWPLLRPVSPSDAGAANRRLTAAFAACASAVTNPVAILRLPGTRNFKRDPPAPVAIERLKPTRWFAATEVLRALPEAPTCGLSAPNSRATRQESLGDPLLRIAPAVYEQVLTGQAVARDRKIRLSAARGLRPVAAHLRASRAGLVLLRLPARRLDLDPRVELFDVILRPAPVRAAARALRRLGRASWEVNVP